MSINNDMQEALLDKEPSVHLTQEENKKDEIMEGGKLNEIYEYLMKQEESVKPYMLDHLTIN